MFFGGETISGCYTIIEIVDIRKETFQNKSYFVKLVHLKKLILVSLRYFGLQTKVIDLNALKGTFFSVCLQGIVAVL